MSIGRTILSLVVALSVAMLPAAGMGAKLAEAPISEAMVDSGDYHAMPCHKAIDDCCSMAACALMCFGFSGISISNFSFRLIPADTASPIASDAFRPQIAGPPRPPPRA